MSKHWRTNKQVKYRLVEALFMMESVFSDPDDEAYDDYEVAADVKTAFARWLETIHTRTLAVSNMTQTEYRRIVQNIPEREQQALLAEAQEMIFVESSGPVALDDLKKKFIGYWEIRQAIAKAFRSKVQKAYRGAETDPDNYFKQEKRCHSVIIFQKTFLSLVKS